MIDRLLISSGVVGQTKIIFDHGLIVENRCGVPV